MGFDIPVYSLFRMYKNYQLCREGQELDWDEETPFSDSVTIWIGNRTLPEFQYQTENGIVTAVSFSIELLDQKEPVSGYETQMALAALSFAAGRQGTGGFLQNFRPILYEIEENGKRDWSFCTEDVEISWRREIKGYHEEVFSNGLTVYFPKEDAAHTCYRMNFQMKLIK